MKTRQYIIAGLIALIFGTATIQAQSTRRGSAQEKRERTPATRTYTKKSSTPKARTTPPSRQVQKQQTQRQSRATQPSRQVQKQQTHRQSRATHPTRQVQKQQTQRQSRATQPARQVQKQQTQRQSRATQPTRQVQKQQAQRQPRATQPTRQVQKQQTQRQSRAAQPTRQVQTPRTSQQRTTPAVQRPASMSTQNNPRSTYRKSNSYDYRDLNRSATRVNKYTTKRYYGGNYYHYAYPTRKVKFHYHHDTYVHNYNVLYYPTYRNIYWSRNMYRDYRRWYPHYQWRYNYGYRIQTISAFDTKFNLGEVAMVYGRVYSTWHNQETDDYLLFFGGDYPYQQFTVVLPGHVARRISWRPERYFLGEHLTVTGLITTFDGIPEIVVKNKRQIGLY